jgi:hypothetical protein
MVTDELITKIILPEYCTDTQLFKPFPMVHLPYSTHYSYLDILGQPVVVVAKGNMVEYHIQDYEFCSIVMFVKTLSYNPGTVFSINFSSHCEVTFFFPSPMMIPLKCLYRAHPQFKASLIIKISHKEVVSVRILICSW